MYPHERCTGSITYLIPGGPEALIHHDILNLLFSLLFANINPK